MTPMSGTVGSVKMKLDRAGRTPAAPAHWSWWARLGAAWRRWRLDRQFVRNQELFLTLIKDPRSGLEATCKQHIERRADEKVMGVLDVRGIVHCRFCAATAPLRRLAAFYYCGKHEALSNVEPGGVKK